MADHFGFHRPGVNAGQVTRNPRREKRGVRDHAQVFRDKPNRLVGGFPSCPIESAKIHRPRIAPKRSFEAQIEVDIKVTERQLAQCPVNRLSIPASGKIGFTDRAPESAHLENGEHMIGVVVRFEVEN